MCNYMAIKCIEKNVYFYFQGRSYITSSMYVPRVMANAYHVLTTSPRVFSDPKMCLRNIWTAPKGREGWLASAKFLIAARP